MSKNYKKNRAKPRTYNQNLNSSIKQNNSENIENENKLKEKLRLEEEHKLFLDELESKKINLDKLYEQRMKELEDEYNSRQTFLDDYEKEINIENQLEYEKLINKIKEQKSDFDLFMEEQKELLKKEIDTKNNERMIEFHKLNSQLEDKKTQLETIYEEKLRELKLNELDLFKKQEEINEKVCILNEDTKKFYNTKKKFIKRHYLLFILINKFEKHKIKFISSFFIFLFVFIYICNLFQFSLSKNNFISNALSKQIKSSSYENSYDFYLDSSNSVLKEFKDLDNLNLKLNFKFNNKYLEELKTFTLSSNETFKFERFYKNNTMILKSANDGQYIIVDNIKDSNYFYDKETFNRHIYNNFRKYLSKLKNKDYINVNRINILSKNTFTDYLKDNLFLNSNYDYFYEINKPSQELFENIFNDFINSNNYQSFFLEEKEINEKLNLTDNLSESKKILENIVKYSIVKNTFVTCKISKGNLLSNLDIKFELLYKDESMVSEIPLDIRLNCSFNSLDKEITLEQDDFSKNAVFFQELKPRQPFDNFKENQTIPFKEQSTTINFN